MPLNVYLQTVVVGNVPEITTFFLFFPPKNEYQNWILPYMKATEAHRMVNYNI